ncbi:MAG: serine hydrolase [Rickettsiales bacterium]|nr:serine hydrolase [Rickettsiales bacterium]
MTKTFSPAAIAKQFLRKEELPEEFNFEHLDWLKQSAYGFSAAVIDKDNIQTTLTKFRLDCFDEASDLIDEETVFNIASITKPITVATILRMMESEEFAGYFPEGLETKLSHFYKFLETRYPESDYVKTKLRSEDSRIYLKDLITHTSGIVNFDGRAFGEKLAFESAESLAKPADGKFLDLRLDEGQAAGSYGEYSYSDVGYELLGMIISATASDCRKTVVSCGQMMREMVIDRLGMDHTFTSDQIGFDEHGRVMITGKPDQKIARGYDCNYDGNLTESLVFRRCIATSGIYSTPLDLCKFAKAAFSNKTFSEGGLFKKPETIAMQNSFSVVQIEDGKPKINAQGSDNYGIGFMFWINNEGTNKLQYHGARTAGYSGWIGYRNGAASCCLVSCQNLTTYFARAKLEAEIKEGKLPTDEEKHSRFCEINADLLARHKPEELLSALRKAEFHPEKDREENNANLLRELNFLENSKKPRSFVEAAQAGKYGKMKSLGGANEL